MRKMQLLADLFIWLLKRSATLQKNIPLQVFPNKFGENPPSGYFLMSCSAVHKLTGRQGCIQIANFSFWHKNSSDGGETLF